MEGTSPGCTGHPPATIPGGIPYMEPPRACMTCGAPSVPGRSRCKRHGPSSQGGTSPYDWAHQEQARQVLQDATTCALCGGPPAPGNPLEADHVVPLSLGGDKSTENLQPAHKRCNIRKGGRNRGRGRWGGRGAVEARRAREIVRSLGEKNPQLAP